MAKLRADRLATLCLFHPLRRLVRPRRQTIPILMYHSVSETNNRGQHPYFETATTPQVFQEHVKFLHDNGYRTASLDEAVSALQNAGGDLAKRVVITFDDGYRDFYTHAFPVLSAYGYGATVFLPTAFIGESPLKFKGVECLTWSEVRSLHKAGVRFGSHTVSHPQLTEVAPDRLDYEIRGSKQTLEDKLGCHVDSFAYPYAFPEANRAFKRRLRAHLEDAGYTSGVSTVVGRADGTSGVFFMKRLPMNSHDDLSLFRAKLEGGYDWLHAFQVGRKLLAAYWPAAAGGWRPGTQTVAAGSGRGKAGQDG
ncbi:MAG TPA: polysaccharide deacetylase family protein [Terriglobia bacterium]|nr:polysaccharide deacetylase family protein [Terriglobia bacterium]